MAGLNWGRLRKFLALLLLCLFVAAFFGLLPSGCAPDRENKGSAILYTVTDAGGAKLDFTALPQRIVSLSVSLDEVLLATVDSSRIAALSYLADDPLISCAAAAAKKVPARVQSGNIEGILALQPDLVLVPDYAAQSIAALRAAHVKVYVSATPKNMGDIPLFIRAVALAAGEAAKGEKLASKTLARMEKVRTLVSSAVPENKQLKVLALSFTGPIGMKGTFSDLCRYAGLKNALAGIDIPYEGNLSEEKMLELDPDIIITPDWDYYKKGDPEAFRLGILQNSAYQGLKAVRTGRVVSVHANYLYSTSQYTAYAVEELAALAYPELFAGK